MKVKCSISVKLAVIYACVAFSVALITIVLLFKKDIDYKKSELDYTIQSIIYTASSPANQALFEVNKANAITILNGLKSYPYISGSTIYDDLGDVFVSVENDAIKKPQHGMWFTQLIFGATEQMIMRPLFHELYDRQIGAISITVNYHQAIQPFFERTKLMIMHTFLGALSVFFIVFPLTYYYLAKPLMAVVSQLREPGESDLNGLTTVGYHDHTELGVLVREFNRVVTQLDDARKDLLVANKVLENRVDERTAELQEANEKLASLATKDSLTNINNHRHFYKLASEQFSLAKRHRRPFSVIMLDIDFFKSINDSFGHHIGDQAIMVCVETCISSIRDTDIIGRLGGEEFAIALPETGQDEAIIIAQRIVHAMPLQSVPEAPSLKMTISAGVYTIENDTESVSAAIEAADQALYLAKNNGRNCVEVAESKTLIS